MVPDLESLRCFEAGATHLNFRVAAKAVGLSPAALGDRIKRLEDQLDARLFVRTTRRVSLTSAGQRLVPHARSMLELSGRCREIVHEHARPAPYELVVGTRFELGLSWLTPALKPLQARRPERTLHLVFGDSADLLDRVRRAPTTAKRHHHDHGQHRLARDLRIRLRMQGQAARALSACMQKLREQQQKLIARAFYEGLSHAELATATGMPLGTVKTSIRRGLSALRECLERRTS